MRLRADRPLGVPVAAWMAVAVVAICLLGLNNHSLWDYHEPYVGGIIREMAASGDWVVPTLNGHPYLEKPPLYYVLGALAARLFGSFDPWVLRLPAGLFSIATAMTVFFVGRRVASQRAGVWGGFLTATMTLFFREGHTAVVDMALTAAMTLSFGLAYLVVMEPARRGRWLACFWASLGFAFLAKGVFGPVMVFLPLGLALLIHPERRLIREFLRANWGMAVALALVALWVLPLAHRGGREFLMEVFVRNTVGRFLASPGLVPRTGALGEHVEPLYFYLSRLPGNLLPWLVIWAAAMGGCLLELRRRTAPLAHYFLPIVFCAGLALLSLSAEKRMVYLLPMLPISFLHAGIWLDQRLPEGHVPLEKGMRGVTGWTAFFVSLLGAAFPWVLHTRVGMPVGLAVAMTLVSLALTAASVQLFRRRYLTTLLDWNFFHWTLFLLAFLLVGVPYLDREWRPLEEPFAVAHALEGRGAQVLEGRLTETQLGYASLELRHTLPSATYRPDVLAALSSPRPVVLLLEPKGYWRRILNQLGDAPEARFEYVTAASRSDRLWDRAPTVLLNPAAKALLDGLPPEELAALRER